jgi:hypothetical protein
LSIILPGYTEYVTQSSTKIDGQANLR